MTNREQPGSILSHARTFPGITMLTPLSAMACFAQTLAPTAAASAPAIALRRLNGLRRAL